MTEDELDDVVVDDMISHAKLAKKVAHLKEITEDHVEMILDSVLCREDYYRAVKDAWVDVSKAIREL